MNAERAAAEQVLAANGERVAVLESELADVEADFYLANQQYNFLKADYDVERYAYEELREEHPEEAAEVRPEVDDMYDRWVELGMRVEELVARRDGLRAQIGEYTGGVADADAEIRELTAEATRLAALVEDLQVDFVGDVLLNAPLLDFMAPSLRVQQTITPNIHDELNFIRFQKMDRCRTCHIAIDREGYETYPPAVYDAFEPGDLRRQCVAAPAGDHRLHRVSRGNGAVDRFRFLVAHARDR